jgi:hypothetical protein
LDLVGHLSTSSILPSNMEPLMHHAGLAFLLASLCFPLQANAQTITSDQVTATLGKAMGIASACSRPTAPVELELEHYIKIVGAGPMEAGRLRDELMSSAALWRHYFNDCRRADTLVSDLVSTVHKRISTK